MVSMQVEVMLSVLILAIMNTKTMKEIKACQNNHLLLGNSNNQANVFDVSIGSTVYLKCDFCEHSTILEDKTWYFKERSNNDLEKIEKKGYLGHYKIWIENDHLLQLIDFEVYDSGIYICKSRNVEDNDTIFTYILDGTLPGSSFYVGKLSLWHDYKNIVLDPINEMFERSKEEPFLTFEKDFKFSFRVYTLWDNWELCTTNDNGTVLREKVGKCFLYVLPNNASSVGGDVETINKYYLTENYDVPCNSIKLRDTLPLISEIVRNIPQYKAVENCQEAFNIAATYIPIRNKIFEKNNDYLYTTVKQIAENGHITLVCPDITSDSDVQWFKDNTLLVSLYRNNMAESEDEPHLTIDSYNSLYILHATKNEEGIYACVVDDKKMQNFTIRIVSKSKLLNDEFVRYSIYLCFVLTLSLVCYCIGICVAWNRRSSFADPLNLLGKK